MKIDFFREAKDIEQEIIGIRRHLHKNAEVGFEIPRTVQFVKDELEKAGCSCTPCGKNGIVVNIGKGGGRTFLLRADMDALPMKEETELDFACKNGNMHACGHDMHTAMLIGAAKILKKHESEIDGTVKLMFQPAEEIFSGSKNMIENGVLKSPDVDAALMIHVMAGLPLKTGSVVVSAGGVSAPAADYFTINIKGKGSHGSTPQQGIDALTIGAHTLIALQEIAARELGISEDAVLTVGKMEGGTAGNAIADSITMEGTLRTYDEEVREYVKKRICEITEGVANTFRGKGTVGFGNGCPTLKNDGTLSAEVEKYLVGLLGEEYVLTPQKMGGTANKSGGSEDFAYVSQEVPSLMLALAAGNSREGYVYSQHHPKVMFDEGVLPTGSAVLAYCAVQWLKNH